MSEANRKRTNAAFKLDCTRKLNAFIEKEQIEYAYVRIPVLLFGHLAVSNENRREDYIPDLELHEYPSIYIPLTIEGLCIEDKETRLLRWKRFCDVFDPYLHADVRKEYRYAKETKSCIHLLEVKTVNRKKRKLTLRNCSVPLTSDGGLTPVIKALVAPEVQNQAVFEILDSRRKMRVFSKPKLILEDEDEYPFIICIPTSKRYDHNKKPWNNPTREELRKKVHRAGISGGGGSDGSGSQDDIDSEAGAASVRSRPSREKRASASSAANPLQKIDPFLAKHWQAFYESTEEQVYRIRGGQPVPDEYPPEWNILERHEFYKPKVRCDQATKPDATILRSLWRHAQAVFKIQPLLPPSAFPHLYSFVPPGGDSGLRSALAVPLGSAGAAAAATPSTNTRAFFELQLEKLPGVKQTLSNQSAAIANAFYDQLGYRTDLPWRAEAPDLEVQLDAILKDCINISDSHAAADGAASSAAVGVDTSGAESKPPDSPASANSAPAPADPQIDYAIPPERWNPSTRLGTGFFISRTRWATCLHNLFTHRQRAPPAMGWTWEPLYPSKQRFFVDGDPLSGSLSFYRITMYDGTQFVCSSADLEYHSMLPGVTADQRNQDGNIWYDLAIGRLPMLPASVVVNIPEYSYIRLTRYPADQNYPMFLRGEGVRAENQQAIYILGYPGSSGKASEGTQVSEEEWRASLQTDSKERKSLSRKFASKETVPAAEGVIRPARCAPSAADNRSWYKLQVPLGPEALLLCLAYAFDTSLGTIRDQLVEAVTDLEKKGRPSSDTVESALLADLSARFASADQEENSSASSEGDRTSSPKDSKAESEDSEAESDAESGDESKSQSDEHDSVASRYAKQLKDPNYQYGELDLRIAELHPRYSYFRFVIFSGRNATGEGNTTVISSEERKQAEMDKCQTVLLHHCSADGDDSRKNHYDLLFYVDRKAAMAIPVASWKGDSSDAEVECDAFLREVETFERISPRPSSKRAAAEREKFDAVALSIEAVKKIPLVITLHDSRIIGFWQWEILYSSQTFPGMSGAPILAGDCQLVGMHRRSGPPITNRPTGKGKGRASKKPGEYGVQRETAFSVGLRMDLVLDLEFGLKKKHRFKPVRAPWKTISDLLDEYSTRPQVFEDPLGEVDPIPEKPMAANLAPQVTDTMSQMLDVMLRDPIVEQAMRIKMQKIDHDRARNVNSSAPVAEADLDLSDE